MIVWLATKFR
uniref:Uncharacterized protein n=1 Tax=Rhizophora mucronata TaxID=61149 RepID=A0A2P2PRE9_RHIMU